MLELYDVENYWSSTFNVLGIRCFCIEMFYRRDAKAQRIFFGIYIFLSLSGLLNIEPSLS